MRELELDDLESQVRAVADVGEEDEKQPLLLSSSSDNGGDAWRLEVRVDGMTCAACSASVEKALLRVDGVSSATVALLQNKANVTFDSSRCKEEDIKEAIEDAGFEAEILSRAPLKTKPATSAEDSLVATEKFRVGGMTCSACVNSVEGVLRKLDGVRRVVVALATEMGEVEFDTSVVTRKEIIDTIEDAGFDAELLESGERDRVTLTVDGMVEDDGSSVSEVLISLKGVRDFSIDAMLNKVMILYDPEVLGLRTIVEAIESCGGRRRKVLLPNPYSTYSPDRKKEVAAAYRLFISCLSFSVPVFFITAICPHIPFAHKLLLIQCGPFLMGDWMKWLLVTPVQFIIGKRFYLGAYHSIRNGCANMDVLVALGTSAAYTYSVAALLYGAVTGYHLRTYFETTTMLFTFVLLGKYLEILAKGKTSEAIAKLLELAPTSAILLTQGADGDFVKETQIDAQLIQRGDRLKVLPGSKIPADGVVVDGSGHVNESMITGEAALVPKFLGDNVIGGTLNTTGVMHVVATKVGRDTALAKIVSLVESAQMSKAPIQKFADYVSSIFVPVVVLMSIATWFGWFIACISGLYQDVPEGTNYFVFSLMFAISVLVIACPCALGLATPTAVMVATGVGASHGILIKGGDALERAHKVQCVVFDKTGTLTMGKPCVTSARTFGQLPLSEVLAFAGAAEAGSEHPLAKAIVDYAHHNLVFSSAGVRQQLDDKSRDMSWLRRASEFESYPGQGVACKVQEHKVLVGNRKLMALRGVAMPAEAQQRLREVEEAAKTGVLVAVDGILSGVLAVSDPLKREAAVVVEGLKRMGIRSVMLTGDNWTTARAVAQEVGIAEVVAEVQPGGKAEAVRGMQEDGSPVAMVGDGVNDAPALAEAAVGMAMAGGAADVAVEAADFVLMRGSLEEVITAFHLSRATFRRIRINYALALAYNAAALPLAAGALYPSSLHLSLPPWAAAAAMAASSLSVLASSLLLRRYQCPRLHHLLSPPSQQQQQQLQAVSQQGQQHQVQLVTLQEEEEEHLLQLQQVV